MSALLLRLFGFTETKVGDDYFAHLVGVLESAEEDKTDAYHTLKELLNGYTTDAATNAQRLIDEYLLTTLDTNETTGGNSHITQTPDKLNTSIQIETAKELDIKLEVPEQPVLSGMQKRKLKKQRRAQANFPKALLEEPKNKEWVQMPSFPGYRRGELGGDKNISLHPLDLVIGSKEILVGCCDATFQYPRKYGLVGDNGCGKSTFLRYLSAREFKGIPDTVSIFHVEQEIEKNEDSVLLNVLKADLELIELLEEEDYLCKNDPENPRLLRIHDRLIELEYYTAVSRAAKILAGLSFTEEMQQTPASQFSGGWLMRISLAKALFCSPDVLLLDEPTNHLDFHALTWLENFLKNWEGTLIVVSHQVKFLNAICTDIVVMDNASLTFYNGKYSSTRKRMAKLRMSDLTTLKNQILEEYGRFVMQFPASERRISKLMKITKKMPLYSFDGVQFQFNGDQYKKNQQIIDLENCSFSYPPRTTDSKRIEVLSNTTYSFSNDSRVALVGRNGCGKTTLLKLLEGELRPTVGEINRVPKVKISVFTQEFVDQLDMEETPREYLMKKFTHIKVDHIVKHLKLFGLEKPDIDHKIKVLSGGQKSRLAFAKISLEKPNLLLLDEPTNHLDIQAALALSRALSLFVGAVILVSHDEVLIETVCDDILYIEDCSLKKWNGTISQYKQHLLDQVEEENRSRKGQKSLKKLLKSKQTKSNPQSHYNII